MKDVTIYDIALKLNLSAATVSRGLQDSPSISKKTKKRITDTAKKLGYQSNQFARNLRTKKSNTIGVIIPRVNSHFMSSVIAGMEQVFSKENLNLLISQSSESAEKEAQLATSMFNSRVDGLLVSLAYDNKDIECFEPFFKKSIPVVFFDRIKDHLNSINVVIDNRQAAYQATKHLLEQGCTNLMHLTAPLKQNVYVDRLKGFKQALSEAGIPFQKENVLIDDLSMDSGKRAAEIILKQKKLPDGVFAANDASAVGCMLALQGKGIRIPDDIAFVGFNNDPISTVIKPTLSTINYPGFEMGKASAQQLINLLNGDARSKKMASLLLHSDLLIRESSVRKK